MYTVKIPLIYITPTNWQLPSSNISGEPRERGQQVGMTACYQNVSDTNNTFHKLNVNDETRRYIPDEASEFPMDSV